MLGGFFPARKAAPLDLIFCGCALLSLLYPQNLTTLMRQQQQKYCAPRREHATLLLRLRDPSQLLELRQTGTTK